MLIEEKIEEMDRRLKALEGLHETAFSASGRKEENPIASSMRGWCKKGHEEIWFGMGHKACPLCHPAIKPPSGEKEILESKLKESQENAKTLIAEIDRIGRAWAECRDDRREQEAEIKKLKSGEKEGDGRRPQIEKALEALLACQTATIEAECKTADKDEIMDHISTAAEHLQSVLKGEPLGEPPSPPSPAPKVPREWTLIPNGSGHFVYGGPVPPPETNIQVREVTPLDAEVREWGKRAARALKYGLFANHDLLNEARALGLLEEGK